MKHRILQQPILKWVFAIILVMGNGHQAFAHSHQLGSLLIVHPYATATVPGQPTAAVYLMSVRNKSSHADRLISASTSVAKHVALHEMRIENEIMRMREVPFIEIPAKGELMMKHSSGGYHLMLEGLVNPLRKGERIPVRLQFERAGSIDIDVWVEGFAQDPSHQH